MRLAKGTGALVGVVADADTDRPGRCAGGRHVDRLTFDKGIVQAMVLERSGGAVTDSLGQYRLCGVPTDRWLLVQVQHAEHRLRGPDHDRGRLGRERAQPLVQP